MTYSRYAAALAVLGLGFAHAGSAHAQGLATATQRLQISAWGGATGTYTGLGSAKNAGITVGADVTLRPYFFGISPGIEVRGTYPFAKGQIDSQKNIVAGLKLSKEYFRVLHPYVNLLFGRGQINYLGIGQPNPEGTFYYLQTPSNVISPGVGLDVTLTEHFSVKGDLQFQRYSTPVTESGHLWSKPITAAVIYRFDFNHRPRRSRY